MWRDASRCVKRESCWAGLDQYTSEVNGWNENVIE